MDARHKTGIETHSFVSIPLSTSVSNQSLGKRKAHTSLSQPAFCLFQTRQEPSTFQLDSRRKIQPLCPGEGWLGCLLPTKTLSHPSLQLC